MSAKQFRIPKEQLRDIVTHRGWCLATDRITVDGARIGFMYREPSDETGDSGWRFVEGVESDEYCANEENWGLYDVNTIANLDAGVVRFLDQPVGSVYERGPGGELVRWKPCSVPEANVFTIPDAQGETALDGNWTASFAMRFKRRIEGENMVIWRPGLTFWMQGWSTNEQESASLRSHLEGNLPPGARDVVREQDDDSWRTMFRVDSSVADKRRPALLALVWSRGNVLQVSAYFDDEADLASASAVIRSLRRRE